MTPSASISKQKIAEIREACTGETGAALYAFAASHSPAALPPQATRRVVLQAIAVSGVSLAIGAALPEESLAETANKLRLNP